MTPIFPRLKSANSSSGLPNVSQRESVPILFPSSNAIADLDYGALKKMAQLRQDTDYWIVKIYETEESWKAKSIDVSAVILPLVRQACELLNANLTNEEENVLLVAASFGMLAGLYESSSDTTSALSCHPFIWNSLHAFTLSCPAYYQSSSFHKANPGVFSNMPFLGFVVGKVPEINFDLLFSRWVNS